MCGVGGGGGCMVLNQNMVNYQFGRGLVWADKEGNV